eukprot:m51a1_g2304 hypothetical protein (320) ;mRNA; f:449415-450578
MSDTASLSLRNADETKAAVQHLRDHSHATNWLLFAYVAGRRAEVEMLSSGSGGLDELRALLPADQVRFALFEVVVKHRDSAEAPATYDPSKYIFLTWLGPETPAGVDKARASADGPQLAAVLKERGGIAIAGVVQYASAADLTYDDAASKVMSMSSSYVAGAPERAPKPEASPCGRRSAMTFDESCRQGLVDVREGRARWALLGYTEAEASRGGLTMISSGSGGASEIAAVWRRDRIFYAVLSVVVRPEGAPQPLTKTVVLTMVGEDVQPLARSRSAAQRQSVLDFVVSVLPFHVHCQPLDASEITDDEVVAKCVNTGK